MILDDRKVLCIILVGDCTFQSQHAASLFTVTSERMGLIFYSYGSTQKK